MDGLHSCRWGPGGRLPAPGSTAASGRGSNYRSCHPGDRRAPDSGPSRTVGAGVYRLARRKLHVDSGLDLRHWVDPDPWAQAPQGVPNYITEPKEVMKATMERKTKFSAILDQGDESEFVISSEEQKQRWLENFVRQTGGLPLEQEEPSTEQISALLRRINGGGAPYADFAVWLPYGKKAHRTQKYRAYIPVMGGYISYDQWRASLIQGLQNSPPDARHPDDGYVCGVRSSHREAGQALSWGLASHCRCGRLGPLRAPGEVAGVYKHGHRQRHEGTDGMVPGEPMGAWSCSTSDGWQRQSSTPRGKPT